MHLIGLDVGKLALRGRSQRAKRDGDDGENGNPGTYDANAHDRTFSGLGHDIERVIQSAPFDSVMDPLKSYQLGKHV